MPDVIFEKLVTCFETMFPDVPRNAIPEATHETVPGWDSLAHVTLLALIGEQLSIDIDFEEFEGATSFASLLTALRQKPRHAQ